MLLALTDIQKRYGGVTALRSANLSVAAGEVHLLLGENGAGKSTLMKIVAGLVEPDGGTMLWNGSPVQLKTPADAARIGVAMVHQESLLAPQLSVAENIFLGREERHPLGWIARRRAERAVSLGSRGISAGLSAAAHAYDSAACSSGGVATRAGLAACSLSA